MSLKLVIAETIGIDEKTLNELAKDILPQDVEIKYYNSLAIITASASLQRLIFSSSLSAKEL